MNEIKATDIEAKMAKAGIREEDLKEAFVRSSGPGGQNVNKVSTCVFLVHLPTGISVKCQRSRQQAYNRLLARQLLVEKILENQNARRQAELQHLARIRRQKRKRSRSAKEKILESKHRRADKKANRKPLRINKLFD